jgi:hypothetical protein
MPQDVRIHPAAVGQTLPLETSNLANVRRPLLWVRIVQYTSISRLSYWAAVRNFPR